MHFSLYGLPQFAISATEVFLRLHLLIFLTQYVGLSGKVAAIIVAGSLIISSIFDPLIGSFTDRLKATRGRVTGFILLSLFVMIIFLALLFIPAWKPNDTLLLFGIILGYQISYSCFLIPYLGLAKQLIQEEKDIITLYSWRYFFGSIGALVGVSLPFLKSLSNNHSYAPIALTLIAMIIILAPLSFKKLNERKQISSVSKSQTNLGNKLINLFGTPVFLGYYLTFTILSIGLGINQTLAIYYYKFGLKLTESETNILLAVYMFVFCLSIPFWSRFAANKGKKKALAIGMVVITLCTLFYPFLPARNFVLLYALVVFAGLFTGIVALIDSYLSNIIDFHTLKQKSKQANLIFGVWRISDKLSRSLGIYIAGILIDLTIKTQNPYFSIKDAFGYGVFCFLLPATLIFLAQKYNDQHHVKVIRILKSKNPNLLYKAEELE